jgi:hypothetical protein
MTFAALLALLATTVLAQIMNATTCDFVLATEPNIGILTLFDNGTLTTTSSEPANDNQTTFSSIEFSLSRAGELGINGIGTNETNRQCGFLNLDAGIEEGLPGGSLWFECWEDGSRTRVDEFDYSFAINGTGWLVYSASSTFWVCEPGTLEVADGEIWSPPAEGRVILPGALGGVDMGE